jgi:hypothetical protein
LRINVFPRPGGAENFSGGLGLVLENTETVIGINGLSKVFSNLNQKVYPADEIQALLDSFDGEVIDDDRERHWLLGSINPFNLGGLDDLADKLLEKQCTDKLRVHAMKPLCGWLEALVLEKDYKSPELKKFSIQPFDGDDAGTVIDSGGINLRYIQENNGWADSIFKLDIVDLDLDVYFVELADYQAEFPEILKDADILILNFTSEFTDGSDEFCTDILDVLSAHKVKTAIMPSSKGILLTLPGSDRNYRQLEPDSYDLQLKDVKASVVYEKSFERYRQSIFPVLVEDEKQTGGILLGVDLGTSLCLRVGAIAKHCLSTLVIPSESYRKVFACIDFLDLSRRSKIEIICGKSMSEAINYFKFISTKVFHRAIPVDTRLLASDEARTTAHALYSWLEVLMIPYPGTAGGFLARIHDLETDEFLLYSENLENLPFLERNLSGISNLIVAIEKLSKEDAKILFEKLKKMQARNEVQRLVLLIPGGSFMSDLDF